MAVLLLFAGRAGALEVGGVMPSWNDVSWIGSAPAANGQVTVLDLWSPANPACRATMPRLTDLQTRYGDRVRVIGLCAGDADVARAFVAGMGSRVHYAIGTVASLAPFAPSVGAPCTLLIDSSGSVLWWGDALNAAEPLARVLNGTFVIEPIPPIAAPASGKQVRIIDDPRPVTVIEERQTVIERHAPLVIITPYPHCWSLRLHACCSSGPFFIPRPPLPLFLFPGCPRW
ncbi:MAG: TlpA family protein disulfide reductase [Planctomycetes bacterium]|nr:TlpA family protein disulfide reductase [Planctomycetota bacterium]